MALWRDRLAGRQLLLILDDAVGSEQDTLTSHDFKPDRYVLPQVIITPVG